jgi:hypothetical protein
MPVPVRLGRFDQAIDLGLSEVLAGAQFGIGPPAWRSDPRIRCASLDVWSCSAHDRVGFEKFEEGTAHERQQDCF